MIQRVLAALVALAMVLPLMFLGGPAGMALIVIIALVICLHEYAEMAYPEGSRFAHIRLTASVLPGVAAGLLVSWRHALVMSALGGIGLFGYAVLVPPSQDLGESVQRLGRDVLGVVWIGGLLPFLMILRLTEDGLWWLFLAMCITWSCDTGAYVAGRAWGRRKLYPLVSPNKTVEGAAGGLAAALVVCLLFRGTTSLSLTWLDCLVLGVGGASAGIVGDLVESMVKRVFGVKDSGRIMPGHGGLLDRVDALMFVVPVVYGYLVMTKGL